jgi:hypothetical protein
VLKEACKVINRLLEDSRSAGSHVLSADALFRIYLKISIVHIIFSEMLYAVSLSGDGV